MRVRRIFALMAAGFLIQLLGVPAALAATPFKDISTPNGPLKHVFIGNELGCQVAHTGDTDFETFPPRTIPGDCGTFLVVNGTLFGPDFAGHGSSATSFTHNETPFTPVSQTNVTGTGTQSSPKTVTTVVDAGSTGFRITETDSYVAGQEAYRTDIGIRNTTGSQKTVVVYRAADCFLGGSDQGFGIEDTATGGVGCRESVGGAPGDRIEEWVPITGGNHYLEAGFSQVWNSPASPPGIDSHQDFPDTCRCDEVLDNGAGLSWRAIIPAGASVTRSHITTFSPTGKLSLATSKAADSDQAPAGGSDGYTIRVDNPNSQNVILNSISDDLPAGFNYVAGSTSGVTSADPTVSGQHLTWNGPFNDPGGGHVSLHFNVVVSDTPGTYFNNATANAGTFSVAPTGDTAPITVTPSLCEPSSPPGTDSSDRLVGTSGDDKIDGGDGRDLVDGQGGNDELCGSAGGDFVYGRDGDDKIDGGEQNDRLFGGRGPDVITGGPDHDAISAGSGSDTIKAKNDGSVDCIVAQPGDTVHKDSNDLLNPPDGCPPGFWL